MNIDITKTIGEIQVLASSFIATNPAGHRLCLIGGFRYRLLSHSCRTSLDIDYHWDGDLDSKQTEIMHLLRSKLLPEVKRRFNYDGEVRQGSGPEADSPFMKSITVVLFRAGERIEFPVELTRIPCLDAPVVRTAAGIVYLTTSDADMIESKVVALFNRLFLAERDIVDLFLFQDAFRVDSAQRLREKFATLHINPESVRDRFARLSTNRAVHARAIDAIIDEQIDAAVAANLKAAGGGGMIFDIVIAILHDKLKLFDGTAP